jgi:acetyl esterase
MDDVTTVADVRAADARLVMRQPEPPTMDQVLTHQVRGGDGHGVPVTVLVPRSDPQGALLFLHGGGFVIDATAYWRPLAQLATSSGFAVFVPEVRLAPEHPFPCPVEDAEASVRWFLQHAAHEVGGRRLIVGGDSSGGNLAAVTVNCLEASERAALAGQLLIYPMLDATASSASCRTFHDTPGFNAQRSKWYFSQYARPDCDPRNPRLSPLFGTVPADVPSTLIITAGLDPLRDEAELYGQHILQQGGEATIRRYDAAGHGFFQATHEPVAQQAHRLITDWLNDR